MSATNGKRAPLRIPGHVAASAVVNELGRRTVGASSWPEGQLASTGEVGVLLEAVSRLVRENERLRKDNTHLRQEKALVWDAINTPRWRRIGLEVVAWAAVGTFYVACLRILVLEVMKP